MRVLKQTPDFDPKEESPIMPIYIKKFGLKPHWFHRKFLYHVPSLIGKPIKLNEATTEIDNPVVARMCVEINILERLPPDIQIKVAGKTILLKVQYEGIPQYCRICKHRDHVMAACYPNNGSQEDVMPTKEPDNTQVQAQHKDLHEILDRKHGKKPMVETEQVKEWSSNQLSVNNNNNNYQEPLKKPPAKLDATKQAVEEFMEDSWEDSLSDEDNNSETFVQDTVPSFKEKGTYT
ncbi:hypothetical protein BUALT_Bualt04G0047200 [Buddleja alternifolia]|uniref:DUF4283 domain-containing protein n=1 Tax=Buddleja alternifolia TaxID=168488 RepID=A0AAV6XLD2_9LAMI|nr:hypothetical protein BUALT_Bualt04G0047200 [Buddleja alternifolia]